MFGLWFSLVGLVFGIVCSLKAREKNRIQKVWFMLGFIFSFIALVIIHLIDTDRATQN